MGCASMYYPIDGIFAYVLLIKNLLLSSNAKSGALPIANIDNHIGTHRNPLIIVNYRVFRYLDTLSKMRFSTSSVSARTNFSPVTAS